jgi:hypothetical protein
MISVQRVMTVGVSANVRDLEAIDSELSLLAAVRRIVHEEGVEPSSRHIDELLDERLAHRGRPGDDVTAGR